MSRGSVCTVSDNCHSDRIAESLAARTSVATAKRRLQVFHMAQSERFLTVRLFAEKHDSRQISGELRLTPPPISQDDVIVQ
mgnify:CR=1 FL=1|jgi:hypothetical protein